VVASSLVMHHLPADLRVAALREMRRVLRPGATMLVAEAQEPRHGLGRRLIARARLSDWRARQSRNVGARHQFCFSERDER